MALSEGCLARVMGARGVMGAGEGMEVPFEVGDGAPCVFLLVFVGMLNLFVSPFLNGWVVMEVMVGVMQAVEAMDMGVEEGVEGVECVFRSTFTKWTEEVGGKAALVSLNPLSRPGAEDSEARKGLFLSSPLPPSYRSGFMEE